MTIATFHSDTTDGRITSTNTTYLTARSGSALSANANAKIKIGQHFPDPDYNCWEGFVQFDTSALTAAAIVTAVTFSLYGSSDNSTQDFTLQVRDSNWGAGLTTGDWVAGASLGAITLLASFATSGWSIAGYNAFTSEAAFPAAINTTGQTIFLINSSRHENGDTPVGVEWVDAFQAEEADTTKDPKLVVTYTLPGDGSITGRGVARGVLRGVG